jgi:hypothetical protein
MNSTKSPGLAVVAGAGHNNPWPTEPIREGERMYAICFDMEIEALKRHYPNQSHNNGYEDIRRVLEQFGFNRQQGSVYFGGKGVDPVRRCRAGPAKGTSLVCQVCSGYPHAADRGKQQPDAGPWTARA